MMGFSRMNKCPGIDKQKRVGDKSSPFLFQKGSTMRIELRQDQIDAIMNLDNGKILCGGVGSGKSRTGLAYYFIRECGGSLEVNGKGSVKMMERPKDLYVITTAMKRDTHEWEDECLAFGIGKDRELSFSGVQVTVDSWNNIKKYTEVQNAFFLFDEQRISGSGAWVRSFYKIAKKNRWILLTATPGDTWMDYVPVFVANGFFKHKTEFIRKHVIYRQNVTFPLIDRYIGEEVLEIYRKRLLVKMDYIHDIEKDERTIGVKWDSKSYNLLMKTRVDPETGEPIDTASGLFYLARKIVNSDQSRYEATYYLCKKHGRVIIFYNFDYELEQLRQLGKDLGIDVYERNGHVHDPLPDESKWIYLVQYNSGAEGWNCISTNVIIFYSQNYSYKIMTQSAGRIDRYNTPYDKLIYYHLISSAPIDIGIQKALLNKETFNEKAFLAESA